MKVARSNHIILLILLLPYENHSSLKLTNNSIEQCITNSPNFWNVYEKYFELCNYITVTMLYIHDHHYVVKEFTDLLLKSSYLSKVSVEINKRFSYTHTTLKERKRLKKYFFRNYQNIIPYNKSEVRKSRILSTDPAIGHLIVVWDSEILYTFLENEKNLIISNPRAVHAVLLVYNKLEDCKNWKNEVAEILIRLWEDYRVLQVIFEAPCFCNPDTIFLYDPFVQTNEGSWGVVKEFSLLEAQVNPSLILNSLNNLNGYPLNTSMFIRRPTAITVLPRLLQGDPKYSDLSRSAGFGGVDGCVLFLLSKYMNFTVSMDFPKDGDNFGTVLGNGTITGSLGDVVLQKVDFAANSRFITDYYTNEIEFTNTIMGDSICVIVPKAQKIPQWMVIFKCFSLHTWFVILLVLLGYSTVWYIYRPIGNKRKNRRSRNSVAFLEVFALFLGHPINVKPVSSQYFYIAAIITLNVIVVGIFQGSLMTSFSKVSHFADINTLDELISSNFIIETSLTLFDQDTSEKMKKLYSKKHVSQGQTLNQVAKKKNIATLERRRDATLFIKINYVEDDIPLLHVVAECPMSFFVAYIVPKGSPFLLMFNYHIEKFLESGLTEKWYNDVTDSMIMEKRFKTMRKSQEHSFSLYDMQAAFFILSFGYSLAIYMFVCEICMKTNK